MRNLVKCELPHYVCVFLLYQLQRGAEVPVCVDGERVGRVVSVNVTTGVVTSENEGLETWGKEVKVAVSLNG